MASRKVATARARCAHGNHTVRYAMTPGKKPPSATPRAKRARYKVCALVTKAVAAEHTPQARTTAVSVRPAPKRANAALAGTWNRT
ncbi:Uncharacterised protein [Mycobacterium tuberculosis]|uniref:Uncharacterized protein n=2 Tax=Mycobacterium tuberculosis TaxID=1773 RepID=A0A655A478_MYCTX|nr:Uncharacterised protein [Mycobacterium tuberculosis]CKQ20237.1 Uncharacterised protein [Mycobacterium tuberculosis]CKR06368.1 Uncharacterised protein [Mycobacterium tuberculosis]CKR31077.1 Uncharacterised protein [Mycobacterium tuberculosis]CKR89426.1 Uncharacterised protein [Mycobacterium tuberculosis]